jgi:hypothetical protein
MSTFENAGRMLDQEWEKLRRFFEGEVKPTTLRSAADALRATSSRLARLAEELDNRVASIPNHKP